MIFRLKYFFFAIINLNIIIEYITLIEISSISMIKERKIYFLEYILVQKRLSH